MFQIKKTHRSTMEELKPCTKKDNKVIIYSLKNIKYELAEKSKIIYNLACPCSWNI